jgi:hypothetical protein
MPNEYSCRYYGCDGDTRDPLAPANPPHAFVRFSLDADILDLNAERVSETMAHEFTM